MKRQQQKGSALLIALIFLSLLSLLGSTIMNTSRIELLMAGNAQDHINSLQAAQAGIEATLALRNQSDDPFNNVPLNTLKKDVQSLLSDDLSREVTVDIDRQTDSIKCPRAENASSQKYIGCFYYEIISNHRRASTGANTTLHTGVAQQVPKQN